MIQAALLGITFGNSSKNRDEHGEQTIRRRNSEVIAVVIMVVGDGVGTFLAPITPLPHPSPSTATACPVLEEHSTVDGTVFRADTLLSRLAADSCRAWSACWAVNGQQLSMSHRGRREGHLPILSGWSLGSVGSLRAGNTRCARCSWLSRWSGWAWGSLLAGGSSLSGHQLLTGRWGSCLSWGADWALL